MISFNRIIKLRDLEIFRVSKNRTIFSYVVIEDTRKPFTEEDKKLDPLCYMEEEDINAILNVFRIALINDEKLNEEDSFFLKSFFSDFVNNTNLTNFIITEYIQEDLYGHEVSIKFFNGILKDIGSNYIIEEFDEMNWIYLSQD
ncbi:terpene synthase [Priestia megaterium]